MQPRPETPVETIIKALAQRRQMFGDPHGYIKAAEGLITHVITMETVLAKLSDMYNDFHRTSFDLVEIRNLIKIAMPRYKNIPRFSSENEKNTVT